MWPHFLLNGWVILLCVFLCVIPCVSQLRHGDHVLWPLECIHKKINGKKVKGLPTLMPWCISLVGIFSSGSTGIHWVYERLVTDWPSRPHEFSSDGWASPRRFSDPHLSFSEGWAGRRSRERRRVAERRDPHWPPGRRWRRHWCSVV